MMLRSNANVFLEKEKAAFKGRLFGGMKRSTFYAKLKAASFGISDVAA